MALKLPFDATKRLIRLILAKLRNQPGCLRLDSVDGLPLDISILSHAMIARQDMILYYNDSPLENRADHKLDAAAKASLKA
jgi:hypothetical protein